MFLWCDELTPYYPWHFHHHHHHQENQLKLFTCKRRSVHIFFIINVYHCFAIAQCACVCEWDRRNCLSMYKTETFFCFSVDIGWWWKGPLILTKILSLFAYHECDHFILILLCQNFHSLHDFVKEIDDFLSRKKNNEFVYFYHFMKMSDTTPKQLVKSIVVYLLTSTSNTHKRQRQQFSHNWFCVDHQFRVPCRVCRLFDEITKENFTMAQFFLCAMCERSFGLFCYALLDFDVHNAQKDTQQQKNKW